MESTPGQSLRPPGSSDPQLTLVGLPCCGELPALFFLCYNLQGSKLEETKTPLCSGGVNIHLAHVVVSIMSISGFVARDRAVFPVPCDKPDLGQAGIGRPSLEDPVHGDSSRRNLSSQPGKDCAVRWTHPELLPQVALINHTNISLTLLYLSWQNPVLPASKSLYFIKYDSASC